MPNDVQEKVDEKVLGRFESLIRRERLAHAYLLIGSEGSGTCETAFAVAKLLNCESLGSTFCGRCASCVKIDSGHHPDILLCDSGDDQTIKIQQVREVIQRMQLCPYEARKKVVIIKDVDRLTTEGANALLKTLEEPPASSLLFLTTAVPERVMPTVKSRCHAVYFFGASRWALVSQLHQDLGMAEDQAGVIAGFAEGCYGQAGRLHSKGFLKHKNAVIDEFLFDGVSEASLKAVASDPQQIEEILRILLFYFKDLLLLKAGAPEGGLTHSDRIQDLRTCAARYSIGQLREILSGIVNTKKMSDANLNVRIPLMVLKEKIWITH